MTVPQNDQGPGNWIKVVWRDASRIEETLKYLLEEGIPFYIMGRQMLLLPNVEAYNKLAEDVWFAVERVEEWPYELYKDWKPRVQSRWFADDVPPRFEPSPTWNMPQQKRPSRR